MSNDWSHLTYEEQQRELAKSAKYAKMPGELMDAVEKGWKKNAAANKAMMNAIGSYFDAKKKAEMQSKYNENIQQAQQGNAEAICAVAEACIALQELDEALEWNSKLVDMGRVEGINGLGDVCRHEKEYDKAIDYYTKAAEKGYYKSVANLSKIYLLTKNEQSAADWCRNTAKENPYNLNETDREKLNKLAKKYEDLKFELWNSGAIGFLQASPFILFFASALRLLFGIFYNYSNPLMMNFWLVLMTVGVGFIPISLYYRRKVVPVLFALICIGNMFFLKTSAFPFLTQQSSLIIIASILGFIAALLVIIHFELFIIPQLFGSLLIGLGFGLIPLIVIVGFVPSLIGTSMIAMSIGFFVLGFFLFFLSLRKEKYGLSWFLAILAVIGLVTFFLLRNDFATGLEKAEFKVPFIESIIGKTQDTEIDSASE